MSEKCWFLDWTAFYDENCCDQDVLQSCPSSWPRSWSWLRNSSFNWGQPCSVWGRTGTLYVVMGQKDGYERGGSVRSQGWRGNGPPSQHDVKKHMAWSLNFLLSSSLTLTKWIKHSKCPYLIRGTKIYLAGLFSGSSRITHIKGFT